MQYGFVSVYRFWSDGLWARETTGQVFWSFDIRHLLDLVKWYSHIDDFSRKCILSWQLQQGRVCLDPTDLTSGTTSYVSNLKYPVKDFLCLEQVASETRFQNLLLFWWSFSHSISFNHPFTSVTLLTLSRSVVLRWHLGSRADKLWEGADGKDSPGNVANSTHCCSKGEGQHACDVLVMSLLASCSCASQSTSAISDHCYEYMAILTQSFSFGRKFHLSFRKSVAMKDNSPWFVALWNHPKKNWVANRKFFVSLASKHLLRS